MFDRIRIVAFRRIRIIAIRRIQIVEFPRIRIVVFRRIQIVEFPRIRIVVFCKIQIVEFPSIRIVVFRKIRIVEFPRIRIVAFRRIRIVTFGRIRIVAFRRIRIIAIRKIQIVEFPRIRIVVFRKIQTVEFPIIRIAARSIKFELSRLVEFELLRFEEFQLSTFLEFKPSRFHSLVAPLFLLTLVNSDPRLDPRQPRDPTCTRRAPTTERSLMLRVDARRSMRRRRRGFPAKRFEVAVCLSKESNAESIRMEHTSTMSTGTHRGDGIPRRDARSPKRRKRRQGLSFRRKPENIHVGRYVETWHKLWPAARGTVVLGWRPRQARGERPRRSQTLLARLGLAKNTRGLKGEERREEDPSTKSWTVRGNVWETTRSSRSKSRLSLSLFSGLSPNYPLVSIIRWPFEPTNASWLSFSFHSW